MKERSIFLVSNRQIFEQTKYGDEKFRRTSAFKDIPLDIDNPLLSHFSVQMQTLDSQENFWPTSGDFEEYWNLKFVKGMEYHAFPNMANGVLIDIDNDILHTKRKIYTLSNWASEVGGFVRMLTLVFAAIHPFLSSELLESYLVRSLFKQAPHSSTETPSENVSLR